MRLGTVVRGVKWSNGQVQVTARTRDHLEETFAARCVLITVPLGVLQQPGTLEFTPPLMAKQEALGQLAMGRVIRVTLRFRERFWEPLRDLSFLFSDDAAFPTWWTLAPVSSPVLTGWSPLMYRNIEAPHCGRHDPEGRGNDLPPCR